METITHKIIAVVCYSCQKEFDDFREMTDDEIREYAKVNPDKMFSLLDFENMMNNDDYINSDSYVRFVEASNSDKIVYNIVDNKIVFEGSEAAFTNFARRVAVENDDQELSITTPGEAEDYINNYSDNLIIAPNKIYQPKEIEANKIYSFQVWKDKDKCRKFCPIGEILEYNFKDIENPTIIDLIMNKSDYLEYISAAGLFAEYRDDTGEEAENSDKITLARWCEKESAMPFLNWLLPEDFTSLEELEGQLIYNWNDYRGEVDDNFEKATSIDQVDLSLEGFYNRFEDEIDSYRKIIAHRENCEGQL